MKKKIKSAVQTKNRKKVEEPGFDYRVYLQSSEWMVIRNRVLARDKECCLRCEGVANQIHHITYSTAAMNGDDDTQLVSLCGGCHHVVEFRADGKKNTSVQKQRVLMQKDTQRDYPEPDTDLRRLSAVHPTGWNRMNYWQR